ncbi:M3 family oligoendopeptidase [Rhizosaccharibacter radicis]|uniref:M3 family oligoendopeptidase n=1 Tax=Rhizosaccharibacter radicis TaxID=2782605 RepID=A0ABT1W1H7_9PROT|nr:M3 family oligoendopeptidase [Acetobacteraceae bacterium KSS12]
MTHQPRFSDLRFDPPTRETLSAAHAGLDRALSAALAAGPENDPARRAALAALLERFDSARRGFESWASLVHLRFAQDTTDAGARADRDLADQLNPEAARHETALKKRLLSEVGRQELTGLLGRHAVRLWESDVTIFDPAIASDLEAEARLSARYTELLASARLRVGEAETNLAGLAPFAEALDRDTRFAAENARWGFFERNAAELDSLFGELVALRTRMARTLGFDTYTALGYRRMRRVDYGPAEVASFREEVVAHVVPLMARLLEERRAAQGWDRLRSWDEGLIDPAGNPRPVGDHDTLVERATTMFDRLDGEMGGFYRAMLDGGFLDLRNRDGKAGGGFCTSFPVQGMPFIFANFNGTHNDIGVFTHEMGHAFQNWKSRQQPGIDLLWPTMDAAEINSMGLEFLCWPEMELLVGDENGDRYRRMHLIGSLAFLPYGVCVDHFQHEIYAHPEMSPAERHECWQRLEKRYMPWRDWGPLAHPAKGGRWQAQPHIYRSPFYYIDYTLALCCALQFWLRARHDRPAAMHDYVALCGRGGSMPFTDLVASAGLASPFTRGTLSLVVKEAARFLDGEA